MEEMIRRLREQMGQAVHRSREILERAQAAGREMTAEERDGFNAAMDEFDKMEKRIADAVRLQAAESRASERQPLAAGRPKAGTDGTGQDLPEGTPERLRSGPPGQLQLPPQNEEERKLARSGMRKFLLGGLNRLTESEARALQADVDTLGGFVRPDQEFQTTLIQTVDNLLFVRRRARVFQVTTADSLGVPTLDTDPDDADWTTELKTGNEDSNMAFGKRELRPHPLAKRLKVSKKLLRSSVIDVEALVRERLAYKFAVPQEKGFLTGTGAGQPLGVFTASSNGISTGRDVVTGSTTDFTADGLINAQHELKSQYWPNARWLLHRYGLRNIRKLKDSQNQYLWQPGLAGGDIPNTILGMPYDVSEYVPSTFTTGLYIGLLADWRFYWIVEALTFQLQMLTELYAETNQAGFIGRAEIDGAPVLEEAFVRLKTS